MDLIIKDKCIDAPLDVILRTIKSELNNGKLREILPEEKDNITVTCPKHKGGYERHPSCNVYTKRDNDNREFGKCHCFTCGYTANLPQFVEDCFEIYDENFGEEWLLERFGVTYSQNIRFLSDIEIKPKRKQVQFMDENILNQYAYYHPYMWQRKLTKEVVDKFRVGFNPKTNMLSFPVWDEQGRLVLITYRSVVDKRFFIEKDKDKPIYLYNFIKQEGYKTIYVCESQINALTLWSWGYPAVALFGTGSQEQMAIFNRSGIRNYMLCFDGDEAGDKGVARFKRNIRKDVIVNRVLIPIGKDVNDLTKEEFEKLAIV